MFRRRSAVMQGRLGGRMTGVQVSDYNEYRSPYLCFDTLAPPIKLSNRLVRVSIAVVTILTINVVVVVFVGSYESYMRYVSFGDGDPPTPAADGDEPLDLSNGGRQSWSNYVNAKLNTKTTWLWFTVLSAAALVVLLLIIVFLRKRIRLSIALIVEGSR